MPWFADALNVVLLGLAVIWTVPLVFAGLVTSAKEKLVEPRGAADPGWLDALLRADWLRDAVEWLALMAKHVDFPLILFIVPTIAVFLFKLVRFVMLYSARVECNAWQRLGAGIASVAHLHDRPRRAAGVPEALAAVPAHAQVREQPGPGPGPRHGAA